MINMWDLGVRNLQPTLKYCKMILMKLAHVVEKSSPKYGRTVHHPLYGGFLKWGYPHIHNKTILVLKPLVT